jgi:acyl-coenzyme A synthetase/AMP-(fatty) acid ligase
MLLDHPAVAEVAVVGLPSEAYGQTMCAIIVPSKNVCVIVLIVISCLMSHFD